MQVGGVGGTRNYARGPLRRLSCCLEDSRRCIVSEPEIEIENLGRCIAAWRGARRSRGGCREGSRTQAPRVEICLVGVKIEIPAEEYACGWVLCTFKKAQALLRGGDGDSGPDWNARSRD